MLRQRIDWCGVQRRLAQQPHLRLVVGTFAGRPALLRGRTVLATSPKRAMAAIDEAASVRLPVAFPRAA